EQGILLGGDRYSYRTLRDRLDDIPADVRIAVLDACASGAFTRLKGGRTRPPFLVDASADMRGHAFLTSSAETEAAQESDRIHGSYFTHYLISGFRGAADLSGDGKITLSEAYQFAFNETLGRTVDTRGGAQHPSYDINLSGSGDVVITDVRQTTATLVLSEDLDGRFFVRNTQELVVELYKPFGRRVELGLEPGVYDVRLDRQNTSLVAKTRVDDGATVVLAAKQFGPAALEATRRRGGPSSPSSSSPFAVAGRHRIDVVLGGSHVMQPVPSGLIVSGSTNAFGGVQYMLFPREDLGLTFAVIARAGRSATIATANPGAVHASALVAVPVGVRWNPFATRHPASRLKPFVAASIGPVFGSGSVSLQDAPGAFHDFSSSATTVGGDALGGVDFHVARPFVLTVSGGYNWMGSFTKTIGAHDNYSGPEFGIGFGFLFGKGR
ncbi:MAG TPA: hypothetical protein VFZ98_05295, partial [Vicinamibacterales bacterium]